MKVIIPMAGVGDRFVAKGYLDPKPLIKVNGKMIIEYILDSFPDDQIVFICNSIHLRNTNMSSVLKELRPNCEIIEIDSHKFGPVYTVKQAFDVIEDDKDVMVCYCDNPFIWNRKDFDTYLEGNDVDGCVLTHTGFHPHTLSDTKMAFLKIDNGLISEIKEKECYTNDPQTEHASTGAYYFRKGHVLKKYFDEALDKQVSFNGEFYVTLVYNLLIRDGFKVGFLDTPYAIVFGTPEEVEHYNAWKVITSGKQVRSKDDLIKSFDYWKKFHESNLC